MNLKRAKKSTSVLVQFGAIGLADDEVQKDDWITNEIDFVMSFLRGGLVAETCGRQ